MAELVAYHNNPKLKRFLLSELRKHRKADRIVRGRYWGNGKGCAVGCTLEALSRFNGNASVVHDFTTHLLYEPAAGIPETLGRLEDIIFERLPIAEAVRWPQRFARAIEPGANLSMVWPKFALWLMEDFLPPIVAGDAAAKAAVARVANLFGRWVRGGNKPSAKQWADAANAAAANAETAYEKMAAKLIEIINDAPMHRTVRAL